MIEKIFNAASTPLNQRTGMVPDVSGALQNYFQPMVFSPLVKTVSGFQVVETPDPINFQGTIQPFSARQLALKPEGQRAWTWLLMHAQPGVDLEVDDVAIYLGVQTRVMAKKNYSIYGYEEYELVQDWKNAGP